MPKAAKTKSTTRTGASSGTKRKEATGHPSANADPSSWRASMIPVGRTITKSDVRTQYRFTKPADVAGIPFQIKRRTVPGQLDMQLYQERDIERRAWERHGGPEGFEAYLKKLYQRHLNSEHRDREFTQPRHYSFGRQTTSVVQARISSAYKRLDNTVSRIKKVMQPWLFEAVKDALDRNDALDYEYAACYGPNDSPCRQESSYLHAETFAKTYPSRPAQPLPPSSSVDAVRAVLADAATPPRRSSDSEWGRDLDGLEFHSSSWPEPEEWYEWSPDYYERLFSVLIRVIEEHGIGDDGWKGIRWEVYDKYAETFNKRISYDAHEKQWEDDAAHWLDGRFTTEGITLDFTNRRCCPAGLRYNSMLPYLNRSGGVSVGWVHK
ncbi:hypothetical protein K466DRAFT_664103 [Polyporus arcularius HHB13444]|uniref:Uncharacterized protein n=1 Tax=Polyporus arcularius HHB13444 TaxID=1314778 RepID=A0A5C3PJ41_9APHY|nr:hypothetical protein K466DRAFT_664103 [Polyporus arcularius HHB13444]